jgi:hypothetical protein
MGEWRESDLGAGGLGRRAGGASCRERRTEVRPRALSIWSGNRMLCKKKKLWGKDAEVTFGLPLDPTLCG